MNEPNTPATTTHLIVGYDYEAAGHYDSDWYWVDTHADGEAVADQWVTEQWYREVTEEVEDARADGEAGAYVCVYLTEVTVPAGIDVKDPEFSPWGATVTQRVVRTLAGSMPE